MAAPPGLEQISLSLSRERGMIAPASQASLARQERDARNVSNGVFEMNNGDLGPRPLQGRLSPFNICATSTFLTHVRNVHQYLDKALVDIVDRWFTDAVANFPQRMPLQKHEEAILYWMSGPGSSFVQPFASRYGMWRTDYLLERGSNGHEQIKICEINSRIPFNGLWFIGYHETITGRFGPSPMGFQSPNNFDTTREVVASCFDNSKPLHYIRDKWPGVDGRSFAADFERRTGQRCILTAPSELQVQPDDHSPTGYSLYRVPQESQNEKDTSVPERVYQCALELLQEEYENMDPLLLQQIAIASVNDLRNIFLIHDKRILGIVLEELPSLEARNVLTRDECSQLKRAIANTLLPGTAAMRGLLQRSLMDEKLKDHYMIKPVRDGMGNGIQPGFLMTQTQWLALLERHADHALTPNEGACVVQKLVDHNQYDIVRHGLGTTTTEKFHLIGSQHLINSKLSVHGPWRLGNNRGHLGLTHSDESDARKFGIVMSTIVRPEGVQISTEKEI